MVGRFSEFREGRRPSELREREQTETRESWDADEYVRQVLKELQDEEILVRFVEELFRDFDERAQCAADICNLWMLGHVLCIQATSGSMYTSVRMTSR